MRAYNEEILVRAVAASRTPVLAAVGHSTDLSLVEMAADLKAITPTAAAEAIWPLDSERLERLARARAALFKALRERLRELFETLSTARGRLERLRLALMDAAQTLDGLVARLRAAARTRLGQARTRLDSLGRDLRLLSPALELQRRGRRLDELEGRLTGAAKRRLAAGKSDLERAAERLALVSPKRILSRGYALISSPDGRVITRASQAAPGQEIRVILAEGALAAEVTGVFDD
jgi:exodeoxyribonuclease VII large subunit